MTNQFLDELLGQFVKIKTKHYAFKSMNGGTYIVTGVSKEIQVDSGGNVENKKRVKVSSDLQSTSSVWLAADEVSLI